MLVVAAVASALIYQLSRGTSNDEASEVDRAVMVDLPSAAASPASDAPEGPEQHAAQASVAQQVPDQVRPADPLKPDRKPTPVGEPKPAPEPPPVMPDPAAVLDRKQEAAPPNPVVAPATQAQEERAPNGSDAPSPTRTIDSGDEGRPHASKHAITLWQRSLMRRIEDAKRRFAGEAQAAGTVKIAFSIGRRGELASERVLLSSGSAALDRAALLLIKDAAPFPAPPAGLQDKQVSFVMPIHFR